MIIQLPVVSLGRQDGHDACRNELVQDRTHVLLVAGLVMGTYMDDHERWFVDAKFTLEGRLVYRAGELVLMPLWPEQRAGSRSAAHGGTQTVKGSAEPGYGLLKVLGQRGQSGRVGFIYPHEDIRFRLAVSEDRKSMRVIPEGLPQQVDLPGMFGDDGKDRPVLPVRRVEGDHSGQGGDRWLEGQCGGRWGRWPGVRHGNQSLRRCRRQGCRAEEAGWSIFRGRANRTDRRAGCQKSQK